MGEGTVAEAAATKEEEGKRFLLGQSKGKARGSGTIP